MPVQKYEIPSEADPVRFDEKYWSTTNSPIFGDHGSVEYISHHVEDVTEYVLSARHSKEQEELSSELASRVGRMEAEVLRRSAEIEQQTRAAAVLRESLQRFHAMTDAVPSLAWTAGPDSHFDYVNRAWLEFTGRTLEQELGSGWMERVHPEDVERCAGVYRKAFEHRLSFQVEYRLQRHDGQYRWLLNRGVPRHAGDRLFEGYVGSCMDVQHFKDVEEDLERSEERYRSLVSATNAVVWIADASGGFSGPQPSWESYTGQSWEGLSRTRERRCGACG